MQKMKILFFLLFLFVSEIAFAQNGTAQAFQEDLIKTEISFLERSGRILDYKIVSFIDIPRVAAHLNGFIDQGYERIYFSRNEADSIQLTKSEVDTIIEFFSDEQNLTYTSDIDEETIAGDNYFGFLKASPDNIVISVSKPLFLRNDEFAVGLFSSFYNGGINGPSSLSIYINENGHWVRWFDLSSGMF